MIISILQCTKLPLLTSSLKLLSLTTILVVVHSRCRSLRMRRKGEHLSSFFSFLSVGSHLGFQFLFVLLSTISSSSHPPSRLQVQITMIYWIAVANKGKGMSNGGLGSNRTTATEETTIIIFVKVFHSKFHIIIIFVCSRRSLMSANASLETVCWFLSFPTSLRSSREARQSKATGFFMHPPGRSSSRRGGG